MSTHYGPWRSRPLSPLEAVIRDLRSLLELQAKKGNFQASSDDGDIVLSQVDIDPVAYATLYSTPVNERISSVRLRYVEASAPGKIKSVELEIESVVSGSSLPNKLVMWDLYESSPRQSELTVVRDSSPKPGEKVTTRPLSETDVRQLRLLIDYLRAH